MTTCSAWSNFSGAVALLAYSALAGTETFRFRVDPSTIEPGQHTRVELRLPKRLVPSKDGESRLDMVDVRDELLQKANGLVLVRQDRGWVGEEAVWTYEITGHNVGSFRVPPIEVIAGPNSFSTEATELKIATSRSEGDMVPRPNAEDETMPIRLPGWLKAIASLLAIGTALGWIARWLYRRYGHLLYRRNRGPILLPPVTVEPPDSWLRAQLDEYRRKIASGEEAEDFVDELTDILREYFSRSFSRPVEAWTTSEIRRNLSSDSRVTAVAGEVFDRCDRFKFSPGPRQPLAVARECLDQAERILLPCAS